VCGYSVVRLVREYKRAAPFRKRLLNEQDVCKSFYAVEGTSWGVVEAQSKDCTFVIWAMARPRDVKRPSGPSACRWSRQLSALT
jgi:hypothetical protein